MPPKVQLPINLSPRERQELATLIGLIEAERRIEDIVVFGSRARGRSHEGSDLDLAVHVSGARDRHLEEWLRDQASAARGSDGVALNVVPLYAADPPSRLQGEILREGIRVWTRS